METTAQRFAAILSICVSHGNALTYIKWGGNWVHLA